MPRRTCTHSHQTIPAIPCPQNIPESSRHCPTPSNPSTSSVSTWPIGPRDMWPIRCTMHRLLDMTRGKLSPSDRPPPDSLQLEELSMKGSPGAGSPITQTHCTGTLPRIMRALTPALAQPWDLWRPLGTRNLGLSHSTVKPTTPTCQRQGSKREEEDITAWGSPRLSRRNSPALASHGTRTNDAMSSST